MFAVHLASASSDWLGLALVVGVLGSLGFVNARTRKLVLAFLVAGMLAYTATATYAVPYPCPWEWRWLGIC